MKARELAEILMRFPDYEVIVRTEELYANLMGMPYQQVIDYVNVCGWKTIPVDGKTQQINCKNHFVAKQGYKL